jgi:outer membrane protein TolC
MTYGALSRKLKALIMAAVAGLLMSPAGCKSPNEYKADADKKVYSIIDQKWHDRFGSKANYKISDTEPTPNDVQIDKVIPPSGIISLPHAAALATKYNRQYQLEKELLYVSALDLVLVRHEYEPQFFGSARTGYAKAGGKDIATLETGVESERIVNELVEGKFDPEDLLNRPTGTGIGFNQLLTTGALISTEVAVAWWRIMAGEMAGEALASILRATITQPLLRGSNRAVVMENLTQAERDTLYQLRTFNRFRKTLVVSIISQYYTVLLQHDFVENARQNVQTLEKLYELTEKLVKAGRVPRYELERIGQEKLRGQDTILQREKLYKQALDEFKIALGLPTTAEFRLDDKELTALQGTAPAKPDFSQEDAINTALGLRLDLANSADFIADAERKILVAADGFNAGLNVTAKIGIPSRDITPDAKIFNDRVQTALELDLPFDRTIEQNIYRKALIAYQQRVREYEEAKDTVTLQIRRAYRDLTEAAERHKVQSEGLQLAQKRFDNTLLLLQYGRTNTRRVLNAQADSFDAQNAAAEALVNHAIAMLNFYRDAEVLEVRPDGMWRL